MAAPGLSVEDVLALEAIAALDDNEAVRGTESPSDEEDALDTFDDDLIDPDLGDEELVAVSFLESVDDDEHTVPDVDLEALAGATYTSSHAPTIPSTAPGNLLKRPSSGEQPGCAGDDDRPAKLNKSFSDGLDEALGRISLDTVPDDDLIPAAGQPPQMSPKAPEEASLDEQLAIEDEINQALTSQHLTQSSVPSLPLFNIPTDVLKKLIASNTPDEPSYWSHTYYRGPHNQCVTVQYCKTRDQSERIARSFLKEPVVGFDMEWAWGKNADDLKRHVSLIQVACEDRIALFHIALHSGNSVEDLIAPSLRKLIESPKIVKTGVSVYRADGTRLMRYFKLRPQGFLELSNLFQVVYYSDPEEINGSLRSMAKQVQTVLRLPLLKDDVRTSNWAKELNTKQIQYAADDAYAGYMLYRIMEAKRRVLRPSRPRPAFAELQISMRRQYSPTLEAQAAEDTRSMLETDMAPWKEEPQAPTFDDERHAVLYKALCDHRASALQAEGKPDVNDKLKIEVLRNVAMARPEDMEALQRVKGVGPVRIATYGDAWLSIIHKHRILWTVPVGASAGFKKPPDLPDELSPRRELRPNSDHGRHGELFAALQGLRASLADNSAAKGFELPGDETLQALARQQPADRPSLVLVPGGAEMDKLTTMCGIDLLDFMAQHAQPRLPQGRRNVRAYTSNDYDANDDCFETMPDTRLTATAATARWVV